MQRIRDGDDAGDRLGRWLLVGAGGDHRAHPPTHRPASDDDPPAPMAAISSRTAASSFGGRSGAGVPPCGTGSRPDGGPAGRHGPLHGDQGRLVAAGPAPGTAARCLAVGGPSQVVGGGDQDLARLGQLEHGRARHAVVATVVGCTDRIFIRNCGSPRAVWASLCRAGSPARRAPRPGVGQGGQGCRVRAGEVGDQRSADRPTPAHRLVQHRGDEVADRHIQSFDGVNRTEHLGHPGAGRVEVEADVLAVAEQPVGRQGEPVAIDLEAVAQAWLDDAPAPGPSGRSAGGRRGPGPPGCHRGGERRPRRAAARRSPASGRRAARGCRAPIRRVGARGRVCHTSSSARSIPRTYPRVSGPGWGVGKPPAPAENLGWVGVVRKARWASAAAKRRRRAREVSRAAWLRNEPD